MNRRSAVGFGFFVMLLLALRAQAGGKWVPLANPPPVSIGHFLLLSDGTVMGEANPYGYGQGWYRLVPDAHGSYVNGTWTNMATMHYTRLDFSSDVLQDGRVFVAGGEYGTGTTNAEIYSPVSNVWSIVPIPSGIISGNGFVDSDSVLLSNGKVLVTPVNPATNGETVIYDPVANTWTTAQLKHGNAEDEAGSVKLPDDSILLVDSGSTTSERYIPASNQWVNDGIVPVPLYDTWGTEEGPGMLLPNGKAIFFGGTSNTAIYTPSGTTSPGSWAAGPPFPNSQGMPDAPAAMLANGKILCVVEQVATNKTEWYQPLSFYEYDYVANSFTQVGAPGGGSNFNDVCWPTLLAQLPDGTVLFGHRQQDFYVYIPDGVPLTAGKPTISNITTNLDGSLHLTGTLFNGLNQGAAYGDDEQMDSNFPIVRFTDSSGNIRYGRTYNWSNTGVMKGSLVVSTDCAIPPGASSHDNIQVIANGIASGSNPIVENTNDSGPGSLRDLVNTLPSGTTITFAAYLSGQTIYLTSTNLVLANNLNFDASALPGGVAIDGSGSNQVFYIDGGVTANFKSLTITNGAAGSGFGGGIANYGTISLTGCTLVGNSALQGGAIENSGVCHMTNCTMSLNTCTGNGAAVDDNQGNGSLTLVHCTVFGNSAGSGGGGVANYLQTLTLLNSIVGGNSAVFGPDIDNFGGSTVVSSGSNIVQVIVNAGTNTGTAFITSAPLLQPLANYGGSTATMLPLPSSPAIDAGVATTLATDQRGDPRPSGASADIGAVELQAGSVILAGDFGPGSLRYAVTYPEPNGLITFAPSLSGGTILLTNQLVPNGTITIDGSSLPGGIQINGNGTNRVFFINGGVTVNFKSLTITNGGAPSGLGGGIANYGTISLTACTLAGNSSSQGGAMENSGLCYMTNCTMTLNTCTGNGGAVDDNNGSLWLIHCTVVGNTSVGAGGGVANYLQTLTMLNSIVAGNNGDADIYNFPASTVDSLGTNIVQSYAAAGTNNGTAFITSAPTLAPFGNYGGPTLTMPPLAGSPAIDGGLANSLTTDQRGYQRPVGPAPDIGSVEFEISPLVTTASDSGVGSLRYVSTYTTNGAVLTFSAGLAGRTITLASGVLSLNHSMTIDASALAGGVTINGNGASRVLQVAGGATVTLSSLTITNGFDATATGGGILNNGTLTLNQCAVVGNSETNSTGVDGLGGAGIYNQNTGALTLNQCTVSGNLALGYPSRGGGVFNFGALTVNESTISSNFANFSGGGIYHDSGVSAYVNESTIAANTSAYGGGIDIFAGVLNVNQCTIAGNLGETQGGGIFNYTSPAGLSITNSIVAANSSPQGGDIYNQNNIFLGGTNIIQSVVESGGAIDGGTITNANPLLAPLGNYGGPTQTMPPLDGSPAIDNGAPTTFATDQRGLPRVIGPGTDIGAVEFEASPIVTTDADSGAGSLRDAIVYTTNNATITFAPNLSGTAIGLTGGILNLNSNVTIDASALAQGIRIDTVGKSAMFAVPQGVVATLKALTLTNGFSTDNAAGGAIRNSGTLALRNCTLANNSANGNSGGAIGNGGSLTMIGCTVANNSGSFGGAMQNTSSCMLENCTFVGNTSSANGGAIDNDFGAILDLDQCTFSGNTCPGGLGGAIDNYQSTVSLNNCIVASNSAPTGNGLDIYNWAGSTVSAKGTNIIQSLANSGTANNTNEIIAVSPMLAALGNYGGPTHTMPPLRGSPAIDAGGVPDLATDQRGYPRPSGRRADIGAVEVQIASTPFEIGSAIFTGNSSSGVEVVFTNKPGGSFTVFASTNVALPLNTWQDLGTAAESPLGSGHFQFIDLQATNYPHRFYKVSSP